MKQNVSHIGTNTPCCAEEPQAALQEEIVNPIDGPGDSRTKDSHLNFNF
jgi:hypothetical protein